MEIIIVVAPGAIIAIAVAVLAYPALRAAHLRGGGARHEVDDDDLAEGSLPGLREDG